MCTISYYNRTIITTNYIINLPFMNNLEFAFTCQIRYYLEFKRNFFINRIFDFIGLTTKIK